MLQPNQKTQTLTPKSANFSQSLIPKKTHLELDRGGFFVGFEATLFFLFLYFYDMRKISNEELNRLSPQEYQHTEKTPVVLVLDNLRSMHNVGAAFRTADAFAIEAIHLCGITAQPPHREIHKTALGATESVAWHHHKTTTAACQALKSEGYRLLAVEQAEPSLSLADFDIRTHEKWALIFGNEVFGVSEEVVALADACLEIPQYGTKHSLNVSVSIGVVLWECVKQWKV